MQLKRIEITGFKSFMNPIDLDFSGGITAVLGPNGCGKTNIVDAIRWVLGEQKTRLLRNTKMENVIFNGTKLRKALGMAEVKITLSNEDGKVPIGYDDVTIGRKLYRSGVSEYTINGRTSRLKDIKNLLIDTGLGSNTYSIIEQEMVNAVISEKNNDKRALLEEAAGVMRYRLQREEALRKIKQTEQDLTRLDDILVELEKELRSLKYQMGKANRYQKLKDKVDRMEGALIKRSLFELSEKKKAVLAEKEHHEGIQLADDNEIQLLDNRLQESRVRASELETALQDHQENRYQLRQNLQQHEERIAIYTERIASHERRIGEDNEEVARARTKIDALAEELTAFARTIETKETTLAEKKELLGENEAVLREVTAELETLKTRLRDKKQLAFDLVREQERERGTREHLHNRLFEIEEKVQRESSQQETLRGEEITLIAAFEEKRAIVEARTEALARATSRMEESERALQAILDRLTEGEEHFTRANVELTRLREKREYLEHIREEHTRRHDKVVGEVPGIRGILADRVHVDKPYRRCFEAVLGPVLPGLLADSRDNALAALSRMRDSDRGRYQLLYPNGGTSDTAVLDRPGVVGKALDFVSGDSAVMSVLRPYLANVVITKTMEDAIGIVESDARARVATLDGVFFDGSGRILIAGSEDIEVTMLEFESKLREMDAAIERSERNIGDLERDKSELVADRDRTTDDIAARRGELRAGERERDEAAESRRLIEIDLVKVSEKLATITNAALESRRSIEEIQKKLKTQEPRAAEEVIDVDGDDDLAKLEREAVESDRRKEAAAEEAGRIRLEVATLSGEMATATEKRNHIMLLDGEMKELVRTREQDAARCCEEITLARGDIESSKEDVAGLHERLTAIEGEIESVREVYEQVKAECDDSEKKARELKNQTDQKRENLQRCELELATIDTRMTTLIEKARDAFAQDLTPYLRDASRFDPAEWEELGQDDFEELRRSLETFGPVNMLALEEYNEKKERFDFLSGQKADLDEAKEDLVRAIRRINKEARRRLTETFAIVRDNYKKTFTTLFDGGEADLLFVDSDDPLEANIKMVASPKGKRLHDVSSLSGGERALTALSLLFAIYLVKPSPFCVFDEVDAPLDDANIKRFTKLLQSFTDRTQFVVITHNKRTMEAADALYGITMAEPGVSRTIAVQIHDVEHFQRKAEYKHALGQDLSTQVRSGSREQLLGTAEEEEPAQA